jgi:hypothetical protein
MEIMAILKRSWKWFVALSVISVMLTRMREAWGNITHSEKAMEAVARPGDEDGAEKKLKNAVVAKQSAEQAPSHMGIAAIVEGHDSVAVVGSAA